MRDATESRLLTSYSADGTFVAEEATTHNRRNLLAEGSDVRVAFREDGTPEAISGAENVVTQSSEPRDATQAYMELMREQTKSFGRLMEFAQQAISILPGVGMVGPPVEAAGPARPIEPSPPAAVSPPDGGGGKLKGAAAILATIAAAGLGYWKLARGKVETSKSQKVES